MTIKAVIRSYLSRVGMTSHQSRRRHPFNIRNSTILFLMDITVFSAVMYLIYDAKNLKEYADCIFLIITVTSLMFNFAYVNWNMAKIFRFIDSLQDVINTSEYCDRINMKLTPFLNSFFFRADLFYRARESNIENHLHAKR